MLSLNACCLFGPAEDANVCTQAFFVSNTPSLGGRAAPPPAAGLQAVLSRQGLGLQDARLPRRRSEHADTYGKWGSRRTGDRKRPRACRRIRKVGGNLQTAKQDGTGVFPCA